MNKLSTYILITLMFMITSCEQSKQEESNGYKPDPIGADETQLTPEILWKLGRISGEAVSPDETNVLYTVTYYNLDENKGFKDLYIYNIKEKTTVQITNSLESESQAEWRPDGKAITYISSKSGDMQLWEMDIDGSNRKQISFIDGGISGYKYAPNVKQVAFAKAVKLDKNIHDQNPDLPKANARLETDLMYRHWDVWHDYTYNHIFIAPYESKGIYNALDIMEGEKFDTPTKPFGGMEDIAWSPEADVLAYVCKKKGGKEYSESTNTEIYFYNLESKETTNFTEGIMGYDMSPVFSPDGTKLAWTSMERDGYESDQACLMVADVKTGKRTNYFENFEESAASICWTKDQKEIYFISDIQATDEIFKINLASKQIKRITEGIHNYKSVQLVGNQMLARKQSMSHPDELYLIDNAGIDTPITTVNKAIFDQLKIGKVEKRWVKTTDNKQELVWVILPPNFDPNKKYPALLYCQGGPQGTVSQFWSYRWNFQLMAANDYIIVAPNRRGLPGFGMEWLEQISKDYGGQNIDDYLSAIDDVAKEPYVDENRLGAIGASYGGFSVYYLAGHHNKRFKTFVSHCGIFNFEQMYLTTEEMWFVNWDIGGPFWDKKNKAAQRSYTFSPHLFIDKWDTPIMVITGANDFRIPYTQSMAAYNAAILQGIPAEFLFFPDESHWVMQPQNGILWHRSFFNWLNKYLK